MQIPSANRAPYKQASGNNFASYPDQCTWWASERYHQLTGVWVPWNGNAYQWSANAVTNGWIVTNNPPKGIASIICLQAFAGQGVDPIYGHVAVVESVNSDGSVTTSDENWNYGPIIGRVGSGQWPIRQVVFWPGNGVNFIYASTNAVSQPSNGSVLSTLTSIPSHLAPDASVTQFLVAADQYLTFTNPFDVGPVQQDTVLGATFNDPVDYLEKLTTNLFNDTRAIALRSVFFFLGFFLLYKVLAHFVDFAGIVQQSAQIAARFV
jgi:surface antigen